MNIVDDRRRITLPKDFRKGDAVDVIQQSPDVVTIVRLKPAPIPARNRPRLVKRKDGSTVFVGGPKTTSEDVRRMLEDFP